MTDHKYITSIFLYEMLKEIDYLKLNLYILKIILI